MKQTKYNLEKSKEGKVVDYVFAGKRHYFTYKTPDNKKYEVAFQFHCTCKYMSVRGIPNGKVCSHILGTMRELLKNNVALREE